MTGWVCIARLPTRPIARNGKGSSTANGGLYDIALGSSGVFELLRPGDLVVIWIAPTSGDDRDNRRRVRLLGKLSGGRVQVVEPSDDRVVSRLAPARKIEELLLE